MVATLLRVREGNRETDAAKRVTSSTVVGKLCVVCKYTGDPLINSRPLTDDLEADPNLRGKIASSVR